LLIAFYIGALWGFLIQSQFATSNRSMVTSGVRVSRVA
jgi:hypothetical protein